MLAERGVILSHTTILQWVQYYVPEFEKRWRRYARPVGALWRVDETYLRRLSGQRYVPPYNMAVVHHGLGEREETLAWLEKAFERQDVLLTFAAVDRKWDALRNDQRFVSLLEKMNLRK